MKIIGILLVNLVSENLYSHRELLTILTSNSNLIRGTKQLHLTQSPRLHIKEGKH